MKIVGLKDICPPAQFYFIISIVSLVIMGYQNIGNSTLYCIGDYNCDVPNTGMVFVIKLLYVVFWTWLLNVICRGGASWFAWLIVLLPILLLFIMVSMMFALR
jgi:hypothetical protein